jgi:hypothetical protein
MFFRRGVSLIGKFITSFQDKPSGEKWTYARSIKQTYMMDKMLFRALVLDDFVIHFSANYSRKLPLSVTMQSPQT